MALLSPRINIMLERRTEAKTVKYWRLYFGITIRRLLYVVSSTSASEKGIVFQVVQTRNALNGKGYTIRHEHHCLKSSHHSRAQQTQRKRHSRLVKRPCSGS